MNYSQACAATAISIALLCESADARGLGTFVSGLIARGAVGAAVAGARAGAAQKTYTSNVLTVPQLVQCLKKADALDQDKDRLNQRKKELQGIGERLDREKLALEISGAQVNRASRVQVERFNASVDDFNGRAQLLKVQEDDFNAQVTQHNSTATSFNGECEKQYYADDMEAARKLAGI
jgi:hypothetical protein